MRTKRTFLPTTLFIFILAAFTANAQASCTEYYKAQVDKLQTCITAGAVIGGLATLTAWELSKDDNALAVVGGTAAASAITLAVIDVIKQNYANTLEILETAANPKKQSHPFDKLVRKTNRALKRAGLPQKTREEIAKDVLAMESDKSNAFCPMNAEGKARNLFFPRKIRKTLAAKLTAKAPKAALALNDNEPNDEDVLSPEAVAYLEKTENDQIAKKTGENSAEDAKSHSTNGAAAVK